MLQVLGEDAAVPNTYKAPACGKVPTLEGVRESKTFKKERGITTKCAPCYERNEQNDRAGCNLQMEGDILDRKSGKAFLKR